jgi:hypothetical protein
LVKVYVTNGSSQGPTSCTTKSDADQCDPALPRTELFRRGLRRLADETLTRSAAGSSLRHLVATAAGADFPAVVAAPGPTSICTAVATTGRRSGAGRSERALIDTSTLLALSRRQDRYHARAAEIADRHLGAGGQFVGTTLILAEVHAPVVPARVA